MSRHKVKLVSQNKMVGIELINEDGKTVAIRRALPNHMLKKPPAWAFSEEIVEFLQKHDVEEIRVFCNNVIYSCTMSDFLKLSVKFSRGFGLQRHLPLDYWKTTELKVTKPKVKQ